MKLHALHIAAKQQPHESMLIIKTPIIGEG